MSTTPHKNRDQILSRIRSSLGVSSNDSERRITIQKRLYHPPQHLIPARTQGSRDKLLTQFRDMLESQSSTVFDVENLSEIPRCISDYLRSQNLPPKLRMGDDAILNKLNWSDIPTLEHHNGPADPADEVSLSRAVTGASETGTLFLTSGPDNPVTLNFLPETHIIVISANDIVGSYEAAWGRLRDKYGERNLPRTVNLISGPSRTADIEQTIIMGAHGPRQLMVIIVGDGQ